MSAYRERCRLHLSRLLFTRVALAKAIARAAPAIALAGFLPNGNLGWPTALASAESSGPGCSEADDATIALLAGSLRPSLRRMARPVSFYHWAWRGPMTEPRPGALNEVRRLGIDEAIDLKDRRTGLYRGPVPIGPSEAVFAYASGLARRFADVGEHDLHWTLGAALYATNTPAGSVSFAGEPGFLLEISVPAGFAYLDLRGDSPFALVPLSAEAAASILPRLARCLPRDHEAQVWLMSVRASPVLRGGRVELDLRSLLSAPFARRALSAALQSIGTTAILASWNAPVLRGCAASDQIAFVDSAFAEAARLRAFVSDLEARPDAEKAREYGRIRSSLRAAAFAGEDGFAERSREMADKLIKAWASSAREASRFDASPYFGCSADCRYAEERPEYARAACVR